MDLPRLRTTPQNQGEMPLWKRRTRFEEYPERGCCSRPRDPAAAQGNIQQRESTAWTAGRPYISPDSAGRAAGVCRLRSSAHFATIMKDAAL